MVTTFDVIMTVIVLSILAIATIAMALHCAYAAGWNAAQADRAHRDPMDPTTTRYQ